MEKKDLKKLAKGQLIKLLSKNISNHEDLLDNDPFKDEVAQEPTKPTPPPRTGKWESVKPKPIPRKSVNEDGYKFMIMMVFRQHIKVGRYWFRG